MNIQENIQTTLGFETLTRLQKDALEAPLTQSQIIISPTGSGKTIGFLIQIFRNLKQHSNQKTIVLTPTRELALQIVDVIKTLKTDYKAIAIYGGNNVEREYNQIMEGFNMLVATPGRLVDHINRGNLDNINFHQLILDEYDKMLEIGFTNEMRFIVQNQEKWSQIILNSATNIESLPDFVNEYTFETKDYSKESAPSITKANIAYEQEDKLETLLDFLLSKPDGKKIIFTTHRDRAEAVAGFLNDYKLPVSVFHGGLDQKERERELLKFEHGSTMLMVCTDLGARGIDIDDIEDVIHYQLAIDKSADTHRNGRTGRMNAKGNVFYMVDENKAIPEHLHTLPYFELAPITEAIVAPYKTMYLPVGKKDKIRKLDLVGFFCKTGKISNKELGKITLKDNFSFVSVVLEEAHEVKERVDNQKLKNRKVRVSWSR